jgi:hypothetical protein
MTLQPSPADLFVTEIIQLQNPIHSSINSDHVSSASNYHVGHALNLNQPAPPKKQPVVEAVRGEPPKFTGRYGGDEENSQGPLTLDDLLEFEVTCSHYSYRFTKMRILAFITGSVALVLWILVIIYPN